METTTRQATPARLRDGSWGARVAGTVCVGDTVTITTRAGKTWQARVERVVWTGEGVTLCATASASATVSRRRRRGARYCEGWGADNPHSPRPPYTCDECGYDD